MSEFRLPSGGAIDRTKPLRFSFDGVDYEGFAGDTLASALIANGKHFVARSFKYHRPRGILSAGPEEPSALITLAHGEHEEPNALATTTWLRNGLTARSQNNWPSLDLDLMAINGWFAPFFAAGFYYKTFMWPGALWERLYEPLIRRAAGLGKLNAQPDERCYDSAHVFCDLLVIGAGPAGLACALAAARAGLRVLLIEQDRALGGRLLSENHVIDGAASATWLERIEAELASLPSVTILRDTTLFAAYDHGAFAALERIEDGYAQQRLWRIVAKRTVLATGAHERPIVFGGNDAPGVMLASAVETYASRFAARAGDAITVFTTTDSGWRAAQNIANSGARIVAVIDPRMDASFDRAALCDAMGAKLFSGAHIAGVRGKKRVRAIDIVDRSGSRHVLRTDIIAVSGGWNPAIGIGCHLGARPIWSDAIHSFVLPSDAAHVSPIGAAAGHFSLTNALMDGANAANLAAEALGKTNTPPVIFTADQENVSVTPLWRVKDSNSKAFVDLQNDVTDFDISLAAREGFTSVEHLKRYTTLGMGVDQGKTSNVNGFALLAEASGKDIAEAGTILARPPYAPVAIGAFAGMHRDEHFRPTRFTPSHEWAEERGAVFVDAGEWKRAQWYPIEGESDWLQSVTREASAVRSAVGICDVSTLGKIEVQGPDAGALLDFVYVNRMSNLQPGRVRYGLMLREDGFALDDGSVARFSDQHFFITTTTANAARVMQHLDFCRQVLRPDLDVSTASATEQWAQYSVAGPKSRALLQRLLPTLNISNAVFPHMSALMTQWRGIPLRLYRLSFSGELAYEIAAPAHYGDALMRALFECGAEFGVTPYGTEALGVLRIEKGHAAGNEFSGQTTAHDLGFGRLLSLKRDYIGRVMAERAALTDPMRLRLVGLRPVDPQMRLTSGAHLLPIGAAPSASVDDGYVTSVAFSPSLSHWIALALVRNGPNRLGERLRFYDPVRGGNGEVELCAPVFVDPTGERVRG
ncbi:MAG: sarcosine oxidase subunit alpha family protein [Caulobacterales bacterium]